MANEEEEDDIHIQTENIIKKIQEQLRLTEEALNIGKPKLESIQVRDFSKSMTFPMKNKPKQNLLKIRDPSIKLINLEENYTNKPENSPFDEPCSFCNSKIYLIKYICIVCNCVLCPKCEINHEHPTLKLKFPQLSSLESIYIYLNTKNQEVKNNRNNSSFFLSNIFSNKCELKLECNSYSFTMKPNSKLDIPITIYNLTNSEFDCQKNKVTLYGQSNQNLKVNTTHIKNKMNKSEQIDVLVKIESKDSLMDYEFSIELFSIMGSKLKCNSLNFKINILSDEENEELNEYFKDNPKLIIESKNIKKGVKKLMEDTKNKCNVIQILELLKKNKGNVDETFYKLSYKNN